MSALIRAVIRSLIGFGAGSYAVPADPTVPANALTTISGDPITTIGGDYITVI